MGARATKPETPAMARHLAGVAARLFAARGYDATSVREICEAAGVTKPTLYYHFGSKEGLAQALVTTPLTRLVETLGRVVETAGDPASRLAEVIEAQFAFCRDDPDRARFVYALFFGPLGSGLAVELGAVAERIDALMSAAARRLAEVGVVAEGRVEACTAAARGLLVIHTMDFLYRGGELGPDLAARLVGDLLDGFGRRGQA